MAEYRVIVPYRRKSGRLCAVSYPGRGQTLYTRDEAIQVLKRFAARRGTIEPNDLECYAEGPHDRFGLWDLAEQGS